MPLTRFQYRDRALRAADCLGLVDDDEVDAIIQSKVNDLYDKFVGAFADYNVTTSATLTVGTGLDYVALPDDFYRLRGVDLYRNGAWRDMEKFEFAERNDVSSPKYRIVGSRLWIRPSSSAPGVQVRLIYVPTCPEFTSDDLNDPETPFDDLGYSEWVILAVAIRLLSDQQLSTADKERDFTRIDTRLIDFLQRRDFGKPEQVEDVKRDLKYWARRGITPGDPLP